MPLSTPRSTWAPACPSTTSRRWRGVGHSSISRQRRARQCRASAGGNEAVGGGAVLVLPGFLFSSRQYSGLVADLNAKGFHADVVPTAFSDWIPVLAGGSFDWYLSRLDEALQNLHARHGRMALVGHSAGGWIARILLGGEAYQGVRYVRSGLVHTLLTLGTPHASIEAYPFGRAQEMLTGAHLDQAPAGVRGSSLQFANHFYPAAASLGGVRVVCACGDAIRGRALWGAGGSSSSSSSTAGDSDADAGSSSGSGDGITKWDRYFAYESYKSGCGRGDVDGDGVTPLCISQLPGAEELVLPGVWHSPRRKAGQLWYGDAAVQQQWQQYLLEPQGSAVGSG